MRQHAAGKPRQRWLHNYTVFAIQKRLYYQGIPVFVLPVRLEP